MLLLNSDTGTLSYDTPELTLKRVVCAQGVSGLPHGTMRILDPMNSQSSCGFDKLFLDIDKLSCKQKTLSKRQVGKVNVKSIPDFTELAQRSLEEQRISKDPILNPVEEVKKN